MDFLKVCQSGLELATLFGWLLPQISCNQHADNSLSPSVPDDLTPEEKQELENIRRRKQELLEDIQVRFLCFQITSAVGSIIYTEKSSYDLLYNSGLS